MIYKEDLASTVVYENNIPGEGWARVVIHKQANPLKYEVYAEVDPSAPGYITWAEWATRIETPGFQLITGIPIPGVGATVESGIIAMWSGLLINMPSGWVLCDGNNGTPDLRDKFIVGAAPLANPGATGGSATHSHTYDDVIQHNHTISVDDPGHTHVEQNNSATTGPLAGWGARDTSTNTAVATGYSTQSSTTGITATSANPAGSVAQGTTDTADSRPPYYALAFIMKA